MRRRAGAAGGRAGGGAPAEHTWCTDSAVHRAKVRGVWRVACCGRLAHAQTGWCPCERGGRGRGGENPEVRILCSEVVRSVRAGMPKVIRQRSELIPSSYGHGPASPPHARRGAHGGAAGHAGRASGRTWCGALYQASAPEHGGQCTAQICTPSPGLCHTRRTRSAGRRGEGAGAVHWARPCAHTPPERRIEIGRRMGPPGTRETRTGPRTAAAPGGRAPRGTGRRGGARLLHHR